MSADASRGSVLVVDDEPTIGEVVCRYLQRAGYETHVALDGVEAVEMAAARGPDLVVLDLMLPRVDGLEAMRRIRALGGRRTPIILLTARGEESDRIIGLRLGADDYIVKPFSPAELVARVDAVLRRIDTVGGPAAARCASTGSSWIPGGRRVLLDDEQVVLTQREFDLLLFLARHPGQAFTRNQLMDHVWGYSFYTDTSTVTVHIRRLRAKLEETPERPALDRDGVGHRLPLRSVRRLTGSLGFAIAAAGAVAMVALVGYGRRCRAGHAEDPCAAGLRRSACRPRAGARGARGWAACAASSRSSP